MVVVVGVCVGAAARGRTGTGKRDTERRHGGSAGAQLRRRLCLHGEQQRHRSGMGDRSLRSFGWVRLLTPFVLIRRQAPRRAAGPRPCPRTRTPEWFYGMRQRSADDESERGPDPRARCTRRWDGEMAPTRFNTYIRYVRYDYDMIMQIAHLIWRCFALLWLAYYLLMNVQFYVIVYVMMLYYIHDARADASDKRRRRSPQ